MRLTLTQSDTLEIDIQNLRNRLPNLGEKLLGLVSSQTQLTKEVEALGLEKRSKLLRRVKMEKTFDFIEKRLQVYYTNKELADMITAIGDVRPSLPWLKIRTARVKTATS